MISYYLMFCVVRSFLVFSGLGLKSPASGFQSNEPQDFSSYTVLIIKLKSREGDLSPKPENTRKRLTTQNIK